MLKISFSKNYPPCSISIWLTSIQPQKYEVLSMLSSYPSPSIP